MDHPPIDDPVDVELRLVDVVARHELGRLPLAVDDFTGRRQDYWRATTTIWCRGDRPTVESIHAQLVADGVHTRPADVMDIACLPLGYLVHVDDYVAIVAANARRRRLSMLILDAPRAIANGTDPYVVLGRLQELADG